MSAEGGAGKAMVRGRLPLSDGMGQPQRHFLHHKSRPHTGSHPVFTSPLLPLAAQVRKLNSTNTTPYAPSPLAYSTGPCPHVRPLPIIHPPRWSWTSWTTTTTCPSSSTASGKSRRASPAGAVKPYIGWQMAGTGCIGWRGFVLGLCTGCLLKVASVSAYRGAGGLGRRAINLPSVLHAVSAHAMGLRRRHMPPSHRTPQHRPPPGPLPLPGDQGRGGPAGGRRRARAARDPAAHHPHQDGAQHARPRGDVHHAAAAAGGRRAARARGARERCRVCRFKTAAANGIPSTPTRRP